VKNTAIVAGLILVTATLAPAYLNAQSGANCTSGGSQSSFRMMQRNRMENLPQSPVAATRQTIDWLAVASDERKIYGRQLMSERELERHIKKMDRYAERPEKQAEYLEQHRQKMLTRAKKQGIDPELLEPEAQTAGP
jgi:hypothetical protein